MSLVTQASLETLTMTEAAKRLGVSTDSIRRWFDSGTLKGWRTPGGVRRIDASSVQALLDGGES